MAKKKAKRAVSPRKAVHHAKGIHRYHVHPVYFIVTIASICMVAMVVYGFVLAQ